jgi:hypothetical protein
MFDGTPTGSFLPVLALAAAGIAVILLAGSLGAATSGRSVWSPWFGPSEKNGGQAPRDLTRASGTPEIVDRSGV